MTADVDPGQHQLRGGARHRRRRWAIRSRSPRSRRHSAAAPRARGYCAIGSVKTNIGHLDAAAGVTGLIKAVLALRARGRCRRACTTSGPIRRSISRAVRSTSTPRPAPGRAGAAPRRAGVSSFGIGGTNAHVVLEEAPVAAASGAARPTGRCCRCRRQRRRGAGSAGDGWHGTSRASRRAAARGRRLHAADRPQAFRASPRRAGRSSAAQAVRQLATPDAAHGWADACPAEAPQVAFLFPGQGAQHPQHGPRGSTRASRCSATVVDQCCGILQPPTRNGPAASAVPGGGRRSGRSGRAVADGHARSPRSSSSSMRWRGCGCAGACSLPSMLGHSVGEYVAACIAGVFAARWTRWRSSQRAGT